MTPMPYRSLALSVRAALLLAAVAAVATGLSVIMGGTLAKPARAQTAPLPPSPTKNCAPCTSAPCTRTSRTKPGWKAS